MWRKVQGGGRHRTYVLETLSCIMQKEGEGRRRKEGEVKKEQGGRRKEDGERRKWKEGGRNKEGERR